VDGIVAIACVFIAGLAGSQLTEVTNHSKIAFPIQKWASETAGKGGLRGFVAALVSCPFCFSHWACGGVMLLLLGAAAVTMYADPWIAPVLAFVPFALAATRVANLSNDVLYDYLRTPKHYVEEPEDLEVDDGPEDTQLG